MIRPLMIVNFWQCLFNKNNKKYDYYFSGGSIISNKNKSNSKYFNVVILKKVVQIIDHKGRYYAWLQAFNIVPLNTPGALMARIK